LGYENSGRRPQPTALKVLRGNPGKRKLNENEPQPPKGDVVKPTLSEHASKVWDELAPICLAMKTLTIADVRPLATLCELVATFDANVRLKGTDDFDWRVEKDIAGSMRQYFDLFGLNPIARAKISVPKADEQPASKWAGVLK
jgi:phage terminase small subunit